MKLKNFILLLCTLLFLQFFDYLFSGSGLSQINDQLFFGSFGGNFPAMILTVILILLLYSIVSRQKISMLAFVLLAVAATSNILDRIIYGGVVDYIKVWFIPIFNLADIVIVGSIIFIFSEMTKIWYNLSNEKQSKRNLEIM